MADEALHFLSVLAQLHKGKNYLSVLLQYYSEDSSLGVEYFQGSMFGYTVYGMLGLFVVALAVGVFWQYFPWKKKEQEIPTGKGKISTVHKINPADGEAVENIEDR